MKKLTVFADATCDMGRKTLESIGIRMIDITFTFENEDRVFCNEDMTAQEFYQRQISGAIAHTAAISPGIFRELFEAELQKGRDVLFVSFSSGLSSSCEVSRSVAAQLSEEYPERRIACVDSLCESAGYGLLLKLLWENCLKNGGGIEEAIAYLESVKCKIIHLFTVDDLKYLRQGGRISAGAAIAGAILGIKPILHMDPRGKLVCIGKVRGRKASLRALCEGCAASPLRKDAPVYISHGGCREDAERLKDMLLSDYGIETEGIFEIGPVIGAHSGPGTLAIYYLDECR